MKSDFQLSWASCVGTEGSSIDVPSISSRRRINSKGFQRLQGSTASTHPIHLSNAALPIAVIYFSFYALPYFPTYRLPRASQIKFLPMEVEQLTCFQPATKGRNKPKHKPRC